MPIKNFYLYYYLLVFIFSNFGLVFSYISFKNPEYIRFINMECLEITLVPFFVLFLHSGVRIFFFSHKNENSLAIRNFDLKFLLLNFLFAFFFFLSVEFYSSDYSSCVGESLDEVVAADFRQKALLESEKCLEQDIYFYEAFYKKAWHLSRANRFTELRNIPFSREVPAFMYDNLPLEVVKPRYYFFLTGKFLSFRRLTLIQQLSTIYNKDPNLLQNLSIHDLSLLVKTESLKDQQIISTQSFWFKTWYYLIKKISYFFWSRY